MDIKKLRAAVESMTKGPYSYCGQDRDLNKLGCPDQLACECGLVCDGSGNVAVFQALGPNSEASDCRPNKVQFEANVISLVTILNALPELLELLDKVDELFK